MSSALLPRFTACGIVTETSLSPAMKSAKNYKKYEWGDVGEWRQSEWVKNFITKSIKTTNLELYIFMQVCEFSYILLFFYGNCLILSEKPQVPHLLATAADIKR